MLVGVGFLGLCELALLVYCVIDVITTPDDRVRNLPKLMWLVLVLVVPVVGSVSWLVAGRPQGPARSLPYKGNTGALPPAAGRSRPVASSPDDDQEFLDGLRRRADEQRRRAKDQDPPA